MSDEIIIKVEINNKFYPVSCNKGEEKRVKDSATLVSETIKTLNQENITASDNRLLVMASMILADKIQSGNVENYASVQVDHRKEVDEIINWLEKSSVRLNRVARLIEDS